MKHKVLKYDLIEAHFAGVENHPQAEMKRLGLDGYYKAVPESIGDCWFFLFDTWPQVELPSYLSKKEIDDNMAPELKMKQGDKVWVWNAWGERSHQIEQGELVAIDEPPMVGALVRLDDRERPFGFLRTEVFPTREALCEHFRKIFE